MTVPVRLRVDAHSPVPIRWQLAEQLKHVIEGGGVPRDALPSIRELAGFLGINPNMVAGTLVAAVGASGPDRRPAHGLSRARLVGRRPPARRAGVRPTS